MTRSVAAVERRVIPQQGAVRPHHPKGPPMTFTSYLITQHQRLIALLGAGAIAVGAMIATAAAADAAPISEGTIKSECKAAGGTYTTYPGSKKKGTVRISSCTYKDINRRHVRR